MNRKKHIISILFMIILIFTSNIVNASEFTTLNEFKNYVLHGNGYLSVDKDDEDYNKMLKSLQTYLKGAEKDKNGNYKIKVNDTKGKTIIVGTLTEAEWKSAKKWAEDGCLEDNEASDEKSQIYKDVNAMIGTLYSASTKNGKINYGTYIEKLKSQLKSVRNDKQYTGELQEYRISLYEDEISKATALNSVIDKFKEDSAGMTSDEIDKKLVALNSKLSQLKNMPDTYTENGKSRDDLIAETEAFIELYDEKRSGEVINDNIYIYPDRVNASAAGSLDDMIGDADSFLAKADSKDDVVTAESLQSFSKTFYNILLTVGIIVAVLVGLIIGIRFMLGGAEAKANVKELLLPYVVGCVVVFGAFAIWKIVVTILSGI